MSDQTVRTIIGDYLREHGFDGLWNEDGECACVVDDLCPCLLGEEVLRCQPGYVSPCDCGDHEFHIGPAISGKGGVVEKEKDERMEVIEGLISKMEQPGARAHAQLMTSQSVAMVLRPMFEQMKELALDLELSQKVCKERAAHGAEV